MSVNTLGNWWRRNRNDAVRFGERDRLGRTSRRPADWSGGAQSHTKWCAGFGAYVFGGTPKTAGETPRAPRSMTSFRLSSGWVGSRRQSADFPIPLAARAWLPCGAGQRVPPDLRG